jgi:multiple sugar transport system permease protein/cellobiose transport system permease protein
MNKKLQTVLMYTVLAIITVIAISPFYFMIIMSTYRSQEMSKAASLLPGPYFFKNLSNVLKSGFLHYYWNSIYTTVIFTVLSVALSVTAGYGFAKFKFKLDKALYAFVVGAMMVPAQLGLIGYIIEMRNMHLNGTHWPIILGDIATCFGVFWMTQYIQSSVPGSVLESARLDGCGEWRIFGQIVIPYVAPAMATLMIIQFVFSWNNFLRPLVTLSDTNLYTIPLGISSLATRYQTDYAAQITALALGTVPLIIIFLLGSKTFITGLTSGAVKG